MTDYKSMFEQAVRTLAAIDEALGIGDDGCGDPDQTLTAIDDLKAMAQRGEALALTVMGDHCAEIERLKQVRCEGCGYLVSEREHLGCKSEKTLKDLERLTTERDNAEKREYEVLGRANALEAELKATQARLVASDELLREEFAQLQDALATLRDIGDFAHDRSTGPAVEDALWEVRRMAYELL